MKKFLLIAVISTLSLNLFSQTFKLETVFSDKRTETYLSYWKPLDADFETGSQYFSLWGYQLYFDDWVNGAYETEYFKGSATETFNFLTEIIQFTEKYKHEDKIVTYISGVQIKTINQLGFKYTLVYDKERKVVCMFKQKQWEEILHQFESYCTKAGINYEHDK
ncbi:hypothetical protein [Mariniphaga anaerophila]|nr:hypothetical protein [Mariniphaga anaerophila]